jgi:mannose-6-phosphate isomerase-like protein (cupin superfamily)
MSLKNGKVWGTTEPLLVTPMIELHRIKVKPRMKCSIHQHERKWNMFYCVNGIINIHVRKNAYDLVDVTKLIPGEYTSVKPGEYHWFETQLNDAEVLEIYYLEPITEDIVRETVGGLV